MAFSTIEKAQAFKMQVIGKIQALLNEFAAGQLNHDQFNALYERYSGQLALAQQALESGNIGLMNGQKDMNTTVGLRQEYMGKAVGMVIYQNRTGVSIETLGNFDVSAYVISPVLNDFSLMMESGRVIVPRVEKLAGKRWLLFNGGAYTTVVTLFHNEPSRSQMREIERLHHDFEVANKGLLERGSLDARQMAYPFIVFVQQKLRQT
jgi:hypothetical protein